MYENALPGGVLSARDLVRRIKDISPKGIAPFGLHSVKRMVGRGRKRAVTWEEKPSQEWTDLPLYLKSRDPQALGVDEIADALGTDQADLIEALRTLSLTRERAGGAATVTEETAGRHFERMEHAAGEAGEAEYRERRGAHPRLADLGITGAHRHRVTTWHIGQDPGDGEWFRPFGRLAVGIAEPGGNPMRHEEIAAVPHGWRVRTVTRDGHRVRLAFPPGRRVRGAGRLVSILHPSGENPRQCNPLTRTETAAVLRTSRAYLHDAHDAPPRSTAGAYNLGRSDGLKWTARTFGEARRNPAYSGYFTGKGGGVTEKYFRARDLIDAKRQMSAYARAHGLRPSTVWQLQSSTAVGRRFAGEWARPLANGKGDDMEKWLDNPRRRKRSHRRRRRHTSFFGNARHHRRRRRHTAYLGNPRRRHHRRHYRHNPEGTIGAQGALSRPVDYLLQGALGIAGAYGVVVAGNFVGSSIVPTMYTDTSITGKVVRAAVRLGVGYAVDMTLAKNLNPRNRTALRVGGAIGIVGSLALDMLGTSFSLGAGDQSQTFAGILPTGLIAGTGAYMPARRGANVLAGAGAYMPMRQGANIVAGLGDVAMANVGDSLLYRPFR